MTNGEADIAGQANAAFEAPADQPARVFDAEAFQEFVDLMGAAATADWLDKFRDGLATEFLDADDGPRDIAKSRVNIHNFCARAGLIGLPALYEACRSFLEETDGPEGIPAAYQRVRRASDDVLAVIDDCRAGLA